jgi:CRP/FNR family cyclic AMP-dependent transcriptional regulator
VPAAKKIKFEPTAAFSGLGLGAAVTSELRKGSTIFSQGDPADAIFYIEAGKVKLSAVSSQGKEAVLAILGGGNFLGEGCLTGQRLRVFTAVGLSRCVITKLGAAEAVLALQTDDRRFAAKFLAHTLSRNARIEEDLLDQLFNSSEKRLARTLLLMANFGKDGEPLQIIPKISQQVLASMVGTTRSRVSFFMNQFREKGYIKYNGVIEVHPSLITVILQD